MEHQSEQRRDDQRDIPVTQAQRDWARCKPWIHEAVALGSNFETVEQVEQRIESGQYQFFAAPTWAVITEVQEYPNRRVLMVMYAGGSLEEMMANEHELKIFANAAQCDGVGIAGRLAWLRILPKYGYRFAAVLMLKDIVN
jgi:hypothetical protein